MCLGLAYEKSGSLLVPMIMHAVFNAISVAAILLFL
jgi:membrane protease YdiL (CAAX protease family)